MFLDLKWISPDCAKHSTNSLDVEVITGVQNGCRILFPKMDLIPVDCILSLCSEEVYCPVRLVFCVTIIETQGRILDVLDPQQCKNSQDAPGKVRRFVWSVKNHGKVR